MICYWFDQEFWIFLNVEEPSDFVTFELFFFMNTFADTFWNLFVIRMQQYHNNK